MMASYPQHAVMEASAATDAEIRMFLAYLEDAGVFLARVQSGKVVHVSPGQVEASLQSFRGVDAEALQAERGELVAKFGQMFAQDEIDRVGLDMSSQRRLMDVITTLDRINVPYWAGRPACAKALRAAGLPLVETGLFARAVKLRKVMYGVRGQHTRRPFEVGTPTPPRPTLDALAMLLGKIKEK